MYLVQLWSSGPLEISPTSHILQEEDTTGLTAMYTVIIYITLHPGNCCKSVYWEPERRDELYNLTLSIFGKWY